MRVLSGVLGVVALPPSFVLCIVLFALMACGVGAVVIVRLLTCFFMFCAKPAGAFFFVRRNFDGV